MLKQKGKRPVALLILFYILWVISDMSSSTVFQQIYYVLCLIASILALGVFVVCVELNERAMEKRLSTDVKPSVELPQEKERNASEWVESTKSK
ncbi:hypothetical protein UP57_002920 [Salmonella enterica subsp. enterica serovar Hermannswerder]|uniref:Uncharacterized protein n=3 Tax=Salmonella TaxID=590 RepID=A0A748AJW8_SALER|nr:hypothetical protein [Salmonella bongori]EAA5542271.1 hypothetical protein [Salmonella enterica subsp. enterica serovar Abony]EAC0555101.1 hypothetical protein [Salmonella enterica subsp. enterica serovar Richmond]EBF9679790.1 hypothetical protein [Salmonella enterica subsp. enterica serovar Glostrup]EBP1801216.1 hypothetical protein [Salmonella enterica]EBS4877260.1 hypothetical protein [Salmonella enterica subsp. enterica serovar Hvittingfoss]EBV3644412.1 hypothetical protein [Salmonella